MHLFIYSYSYADFWKQIPNVICVQAFGRLWGADGGGKAGRIGRHHHAGDDQGGDEDNVGDDNTGFKDGMYQTVNESPAFANAVEDNFGECEISTSYW